MSYQVLARKWRPQTFQTMVGQEHVLRMLVNALDSQRLHHAYLFTGTRGVGKTTLARILAKCLNCESGITPTPCDTCAACQAINAGRFLDLLEIDAASRTKVEDTRELLDNVQYAPTQGRFKIYLIDEVHMLSGHSFNALLKTLEEPPAHVKFLLATTDPKRLPVTILSRCLQFNLKRVPVTQIMQHLQHICITENFSAEPAGLEQLAQAADGSLRDALSLLDQAIAFCQGNITTADVRNMLGNIEQDYIFRLLVALAEADGKKLLTEIATLAEHAPDFDHILENILSCLHHITVAQTVADYTELPSDIITLAQRLTPQDVQLYYQIALIGRRDLPLAASPLQGFEMIMLSMLAFQPASTTNEIKKTEPTPTVKTEKNTTALDKTEWTTLLEKLNLTGMSYALAANCSLLNITDNVVQLVLSKKHEPMLNPKAIARIEEALSKYFNKPTTIKINLSTDELNTFAKQKEQTQKIRQASALEAIKADNHVQKIMDVFDATLDVNSVKALD
jgi:DNA polymerase-3 subunit gamma/tau